MCTPAKVRGCSNFVILGFLGGGIKIFLISGAVVLWAGIFLREAGSFYVHFPILKCKISKIQKFLAPSFSIFTFSDLRYMQGFKYILALTLNLNFLVQLCECRQTWQLLVKIEKDSSVNKQPGKQHKVEFLRRRALTRCLWLISLYIWQYFINVFTKKICSI